MKGNNGSGNIEERDVWETPQELWNKLNEQYEFKFDCCASIKNKKTLAYSDDFLNCLEECRGLMCWMNPPFSKAGIMFERFFNVVWKGIAIYRCDNLETKVWQENIFPYADWIFIPKGRICYEGMQGKGSRFPSALIGFDVEPPKNIDGTLLIINSI